MKRLLTITIASLMLALPVSAQQEEVKNKTCKLVSNGQVLLNGRCEVTYRDGKVIRFGDGNYRTVCPLATGRCAGYQMRTASYGAFGYLLETPTGDIHVAHNSGRSRKAHDGFTATEKQDRNRCMVTQDWKSYLCIY